MRYLLDANVFITAKNLHYGFDFCPAFWDWLRLAHEHGTVFSIEKVHDELMAQDDELTGWAEGVRRLVLYPAGPEDACRPWARFLPGCKHNPYTPAAKNTFFLKADYYLIAAGSGRTLRRRYPRAPRRYREQS
ncbi:MAG: hypothetical protein KatS3mg111_3466 [Pirellulaceae bacterium]|nr:MAG: hypothetical protein KatS3mg111_3466 [Pirellulaceae bacterium]